MFRPTLILAAFCLFGVTIEANPTCVSKAADIMFVLDSSTSIWIVDYKEKLKFVADLVKSFGVARGDSQIRVGAITFSDSAHLEFSFDTYNKLFQLKKAILNIPHRQGGTNTAEALRVLEDEVEPNLRNSKGPTIAVVITDGQSMDHEATKEQARRLHELGVIVYAIGVGESYDIKELEAIASNPNNVLTVTSYSALKEIKDTIYVRVCGETDPSKHITSHETTTTTTAAPTEHYEETDIYETTDAPTDRKSAAGLPIHIKHESVETGSVIAESSNCISKAADIMFVLDSSTSIWIVDYKEKLKFVADLVKSFGVARGDSQIRVGAITFSDESHLEFSFDTYNKAAQLKKAILNIPHRQGGTNTADALRLLKDQVESSMRHSKGPTIAVVITDGQSMDHEATKEEARKLHELGVIVYAIGVGESYDIKELEAIASNPDNVLTVTSYSVLKEIKDTIYVRVCGEKPAVHTTATHAPPANEIVIAGSVNRDPSSIILFGYDLVAMGAYRSGMIHQVINSLLPYIGYGHFGIVTYGYCPSRFNVPITPLKDSHIANIVNNIPVDIELPNLVDVVRQIRKLFHSRSMLNDQSGLMENQVAVLFIDPSITTITPGLIKEIDTLKRNGVKLYLINVGTCSSSQLDHLYSLSSQPYRKYMFSAPSFHQLLLKAQRNPLHFKSIYNEYMPRVSERKESFHINI